ncbi:MAG: flotillin family protein [Chloroflexia bacterium]|nr:flotillin family protein [Chloroflexia bacterium]
MGFAYIAGMIIILVLLFVFWASCYRKVGPNEALIISGTQQNVRNPATGELQQRGFRVIKGGGTFVYPIVERADLLSLEIIPFPIEIERLRTRDGALVTLRGTGQVRIGGDEVSIVLAAERLLSQSPEQIAQIARQLLERPLRATVNSLELELLQQDLEGLAQEVQELWAEELLRIGLESVSFSVKELGSEPQVRRKE